MDQLNTKILTNLRENARLTNLEIAKKLNVSEGTIRRRVAVLAKRGVIKRFTIEIARGEIFAATVLISTEPSFDTPKLARELAKIQGIENVREVAGKSADVILDVECSNSEEFNKIVEEIRKTDGMRNTESLVVLKRH